MLIQPLKDLLLEAPESQIPNTLRPLIHQLSDSPKAIEVVPLLEHEGIAQHARRLIHLYYDHILEQEKIDHLDVVVALENIALKETDMTSPVKGFRGAHFFLSNFFPVTVKYEGHPYPSVEHAYQAAKTSDFSLRAAIARMESPGKAKRNAPPRPKDWNFRSVGVMRILLREKFKRGSNLARLLLKTGDAYLEEENSWGDTFWGVCEGEGQNMLGKLLMERREELQEDE